LALMTSPLVLGVVMPGTLAAKRGLVLNSCDRLRAAHREAPTG
jgi:hypothetical protein